MTANIKVRELDDSRIPCYFGFTTQKQWKNYIKDLLKHNDKAVMRAVIRIYERQTFDEQLEQASNEVNGIGFNKNDAPFLSTVAIAFLTNKKVDKKTFEITRNKMMHYWKQLMQISKEDLDDRLRDIKLKLLNNDLEACDKEANNKYDVKYNTDDECNNYSDSSSDSGEDSQGYLFPELFGKAKESFAADNSFDSRCVSNASGINT